MTIIGADAFSSYSGLSSITIGNAVTTISEFAFAYCHELLNVYCYAADVPNTLAYAFEDSYPEAMTLHVPESALENYKTTSPWSSFKEFVALPNYKLTYIVDGETYKTYKYEEDRKIPVEPAPEKEGYTFLGWSNLPETMPSEDVTVTAIYKKSSLGKCITPTIAYKEGKIVFESDEDGVNYVWEINVADVGKGNGKEIGLTGKYAISVYATKEGYENSDVATKTIDLLSLSGDVNGDGKVDATDLTKLIDILLKRQKE